MTNENRDDELRLLIQKVSRRIRVNRADEGITDGQLGVLFHLERDGVRTPSELAADEHVTPPSMNRTLNAMEAAGWIRRAPSGDDGRKVLITLTDAGLEVIAETRRLRTVWFSQRLAELSDDERAALDAVMPTLRKLAQS